MLKSGMDLPHQKLPVRSKLAWPPPPSLNNKLVINLQSLVRSSKSPNYVKCKIPVPTHLNIKKWSVLLKGDKDQTLIDHLKFGFPINYTSLSSPVVPLTNHRSAIQYSEAVDNYIRKELSAGSLIGPFSANPLNSDVIISPLQSVEKKNSDKGARRIVVDLSFPKGTSVNDGIPKDSYLGEDHKLRLPSVDALIDQVRRYGSGCLIFKVDLARAYRQLLYMCPNDVGLCAFSWRGSLFIDITFPFGIRSACLNCQRVADAICRIYMRMHGKELVGYVDDFAAAQPVDTAPEAYQQLVELLHDTLGIELSTDKCIEPATKQTFLGIEVDTVAMCLRIPQDKLDRAKDVIRLWLNKTTATKKQLQSLLGLLIHISTAVFPGRRFVCRIIELIKLDNAAITLDYTFKLDLVWWDQFIEQYNGVSLIQDATFSPCDSVLATDSCLTGMGAITSHGFYCHAEFPLATRVKALSISALELLAVVVACRLWGHLFSRQKLVIKCDNEGVCQAVNSGRARAPFLQAALRNLWYTEAINNFTIRCVHIPGINNTIPDMLSRWHLDDRSQAKFNNMCSSMQVIESSISKELFDIYEL